MVEIEAGKLEPRDLVFLPKIGFKPTTVTDLEVSKYGKTVRNEVFESDGRIFFPIKEIKEFDYDGAVYDLNISGNHSYIVGPMSVHNTGEDYDMLGRIYKAGGRLVSTSYAWMWHHWSKSQEVFNSGELDDPYYKCKPYWNKIDELWPPEKNEGHKFDIWGSYRDEQGNKKLLYRVPDIGVEEI